MIRLFIVVVALAAIPAQAELFRRNRSYSGQSQSPQYQGNLQAYSAQRANAMVGSHSPQHLAGAVVRNGNGMAFEGNGYARGVNMMPALPATCGAPNGNKLSDSHRVVTSRDRQGNTIYEIYRSTFWDKPTSSRHQVQ